jgi:hypothetical protein
MEAEGSLCWDPDADIHTIKKSFATEGLFSMGISIKLIPVVFGLERTILGYTQVFGLCF